jgi:hypothetical protein
MRRDPSELRRKLAKLGDKLLSGSMSSSDGLQVLIHMNKTLGKELAVQNELSNAWEALVHFCNDEDIRGHDAEYAAYQVDRLRQLLNELKAK